MADLKLISYAGGKLLTAGSGDNVQIGDNVKFQIGDSQDLELYHDGTDSFVANKTGSLKIATETSGVAITIGHTTSEVTIADNLTVAGNLTVSGETTTISTNNTLIADKLLELANGTTGTPSGDAGIIIERGDSNNAIFAWDESSDRFVLGTTTATGASSGDLTITDASLQVSSLFLGTSEVTATAAELNLLDGGASVGSSITITDSDGLLINDGGTMKSFPASDLKNYINASSAGSVAADDIIAGDAAVEITTTVGDVVVDAPSGQSVDLQVAGSNVVEVAGDRVSISQPAILTTAGASLAPSASHPAFVAGNVLAFEAGATGGLELADCSGGGNYVDAPFGVALEASAEDSTTPIMVHTVHGGLVNIKIASSTLDKGQWVYLDTTAGQGVLTAPTAGMVWRLGLVAEYNASAQTDADILWMPQFIADLG